MQREHTKVYFQPLLEKKSLLDISNLKSKSIAKTTFIILKVRNRALKIYRHIDICRFSDRKNIVKHVSLNRRLLF